MSKLDSAMGRENILNVHLVFVDIGFGGSQRRFIDLACSLASCTLMFTVYAPDDTIAHAEIIIADYERSRRFVTFVSIGPKESTIFSRLESLSNSLLKNVKHTDVIHLVHAAVVPWRLRNKVIYSHCNNSLPSTRLVQWLKAFICGAGRRELRSLTEADLKPMSVNSVVSKVHKLFLYYLNFRAMLRACRIDVLNPLNAIVLRRIPVIRRKVTLTKGFARIGRCVGESFDRDIDILWVGRFEKGKGLDDFVNLLLSLESIAEGFSTQFDVLIIGEGSCADSLVLELNKLSGSKIRVSIRKTQDPRQFFLRSKIFVSFQTASNYPSRSLMEAVIHGAIPILLDSGESRIMVPRGYPLLLKGSSLAIAPLLCYLVKSHSLMAKILRLDLDKFSVRFNSEKQVFYYKRMYNSLR